MTEPRYTLGERQENGWYPVTVNQIEAGHIYRRHGSWYAVMPGQPEARHHDRYTAADHLVTLIDAGQRPQAKTAGIPPTPDTASLIGALLSTDLRFTASNIVRAAEATARLAELGWKPLEGYPGADQPWRMRCLLCGWEGRRFWSHLRGRNGDQTPRPLSRHKGCISISKHAAKIKSVTVQATECRCLFRHATDPIEAAELLSLCVSAHKKGRRPSLYVHLSRLLDECPAASTRAIALRKALTQGV